MSGFRCSVLAINAAVLFAVFPSLASAQNVGDASVVGTGTRSLVGAGLATDSAGRPAALLVDKRGGRVTLWRRGGKSPKTVSRRTVATLPFGKRPDVLRAAGDDELITYWEGYKNDKSVVAVAYGARLERRQEFVGYEAVDLASSGSGAAALLLRKEGGYGRAAVTFAVTTRESGKSFVDPVAVGSAISGAVAVDSKSGGVLVALRSATGVHVSERVLGGGYSAPRTLADDAFAGNIALGVYDGRATVAWTSDVVGGRVLVASSRSSSAAEFGAPTVVSRSRAAALDQAPMVYVTGTHEKLLWAADYGSRGIWPVASYRSNGAWRTQGPRMDSTPSSRAGVTGSEPFDATGAVGVTITDRGRVKTADVWPRPVRPGNSRFQTVFGSGHAAQMPYIATGGGRTWLLVTVTKGKRNTIRFM